MPVSLDEANAFVAQHHRHHKPVVGAKFSLGVVVTDEGAEKAQEIVGVAIVGRPVGRRLDDGWTLEVTRACTNGTPNANSFLYAASWRAAKALGYRRLITYTMKSESGRSLRAAGWKLVGETPGRSWSVPSRPRVDKHPLQGRLRWEA